ncbi:MAG: hypothetical protein AB1502_16095, partial [Thermodesulfobacteriota bacterium]
SLALKMPIELYSNPREVIPPTGEPDAGDPHVRFGGRGDANQCIIPTPIEKGNTGFLLPCLPQAGELNTPNF